MKKTILALSILAVFVTTCLTSLALPPGGGTECPDRCNSDDVNCCTDPKGTLHCGRLP